MGLFDIFSDQPAKDAAAAQTAGLNKGYDLASGLYTAGNSTLNTQFGKAGDLYSGLQQSTQGGSNAYGDATGANGPEGLARAKALFTQTPGYQSGFDLLSDTNDRKAASRGMLGSGNTIADTTKLATTYADQNYSNYAARLQPYLPANASAVAGGATTATGLGAALNANDQSQGQLGFNTQSGIGNANANADLAKYTASGNFMNALMGAAKLAAGGFGGGFGGGAPGGGGTPNFAPTPNGPGTYAPMFT